LIDVARHVRIICKKTFDGNTESDAADTFAKALFDVINGKTVVATIPVNIYRNNPGVAIIFDD
jgi:hypothetical protein